jgi:tRNA1Val (adenine37-N6)-methyltransferase
MADIFQFQQFAVDQSGCAMKVNTDGVLLGALADGDAPLNILDIGTGTGVMALMLAQRFPDAEVDAVEMNPAAAKTAEHNFEESPFSGRLTAYQQKYIRPDCF